jgi:ABC-2 type transport system permease protein
MINKLFTIARNTFTETIRQPVYAVIIVSALFLFLMSPSLTMYSMSDDNKLLREIGLSTLFLSGLFIAIFAAAGAVTEEIETKTITTVLTKPVARPVFILGKFFGVGAAVMLAHYIGTIALLLTMRHGVLATASDTHDWTVITVAVAAGWHFC